MNASAGVVCDELPKSSQSPFIFYVVFGLLMTAVILTLVLFLAGRRRRPSAAHTAAAGEGAHLTARIKLVVVSAGQQQPLLT